MLSPYLLGMDFYTKMIDVDGNNTVMELWDTAGQERSVFWGGQE